MQEVGPGFGQAQVAPALVGPPSQDPVSQVSADAPLSQASIVLVLLNNRQAFWNKLHVYMCLEVNCNLDFDCVFLNH